MTKPTDKKRRAVRFGLRTLLILTLVSALFFGWFSQEQRRRKFLKHFVTVGKVDFTYRSDPTFRSVMRGIFGDLVSDEVESMDLYYSHLIDSDMRGVELIPELTSLNIIGNNITDAGIRRLDGMRNLRKLYVGGDNARGITDEGLLHLGGLRNLKELELRKTGIQGPGLRVLSKMPQLEKVSLWKSEIDESGLPYLKQLVRLKKLVVGRTNLSPEAIEELRSALPNCEIVDDV